MNRKTLLVIMSATLTGVVVYLFRREYEDRKRARVREAILEKARKHDHGEFVL